MKGSCPGNCSWGWWPFFDPHAVQRCSSADNKRPQKASVWITAERRWVQLWVGAFFFFLVPLLREPPCHPPRPSRGWQSRWRFTRRHSPIFKRTHKGACLMIYYPAPLWKSKWILESAPLFKSRPGGMWFMKMTPGNPARPNCVCLSGRVWSGFSASLSALRLRIVLRFFLFVCLFLEKAQHLRTEDGLDDETTERLRRRVQPWNHPHPPRFFSRSTVKMTDSKVSVLVYWPACLQRARRHTHTYTHLQTIFSLREVPSHTWLRLGRAMDPNL